MVQPVQQPFSTTHRGPYTAEDRAAMPEDGHRVELVDGHLVVSPSPGRAHNDLLMQLFRQLDAARPDGVTVYSVPYDFRLADGSELVPDITVARTADLGDERLGGTPLLVVEVISPSSRTMDPVVKRAKYEGAGVPAYWIADPAGPRLTVLELHAGRYVERAVLGAGDQLTLIRPYAVTVQL